MAVNELYKFSTKAVRQRLDVDPNVMGKVKNVGSLMSCDPIGLLEKGHFKWGTIFHVRDPLFDFLEIRI